ncbi:TIGR02594 family protein [Fulvimarina sp. 2208YS6-2-32]|uniref:TIGR02594 family protein n=1 Tax=Fulvimarina uroteuthidis TaxID=3098149 RepID=A0ABU5HY88_9HYPH|nr:TIGR02594 family protein [Fulvimarina sp. 2208YS6-2-32]MDY8107770.1 TIGR02594 family protein [Fulvimarina sp. 2208YS6-2-32]
MPRAAEYDLSVQVEAKIDRLEKQMKRADALVDRQFRSMERRAETAAGRFERSMAKAASGMQTRLAGLGKGFLIGTAGVLGVQSGREIARYADEYRGLQNSLRDAGREGKDLTKTFGDLFRIAQDQGAALGSLVGLYRDAAAAGDVLNATEADRLKFASGVANALRIEGKSAQEAAGPLQQLGQLLAAGTVRAEEFNSVNEGTRPILQAVADGLEEAGGSIAKLRKLVLDGKLSSEAFFRAFLAGSDKLAERADRAEGRIGQSMNRIGNAMVLLAGHVDEVSGASDNAAAGLNHVASAIEALPGYIDAAVSGMASLRKYLNDLGNAPIFGKINEMLGIAEMTPDEMRALGINPVAGTPSTTPDGRIAQAFDATNGTGIPEGVVQAGKAGRVIGEGAQEAKVSLKDFATSLDDASDATKAKKSAPIETARDYIGLDENRDRDVLSNLFKQAGHSIDPKMTAWCAAFVNAVLATNGLPGTGKLNAQSFLDYGEKTSKPEQGDIVVLKRGKEAWQGHVGFFEGYDARGGVRVLGGNQRDGVNVQSFSANDVLGYRRIPGAETGGAPESNAADLITQRIEAEEAARDAIAKAREEAATERQRDAEGYAAIIAGSNEFSAAQQLEQQALGMSAQAAAAARYEAAMLNQATREGIALSPERRAEIKQAAAGMAELEQATQKAATAQSDIKAAQDFFAGGASDFFTSIITGSASAEQALQQLLASLAKAALEAAFLGSGPLGGLFGGGGGIFSALFGSIFPFAEGGIAANGRPVSLPRFAKGGVSRSAAIFGEAGPEAAVPLPDGRSIPVDLRTPDVGRSPGATNNVQNVTIAPTISVKVDGRGNDEKTNGDMARQTAKAVEGQLRAIVHQELRHVQRSNLGRR